MKERIMPTQVCSGCSCVKDFVDSKSYSNNYCNTCGKKLNWDHVTNPKNTK